jgi:hypothetical protein
MAKTALDGLLAEDNNIQLEIVDILSNPLRTLKDGVTFIPTLKSGEEQLSGLFLSKEKIKKFLNKVHTS